MSTEIAVVPRELRLPPPLHDADLGGFVWIVDEGHAANVWRDLLEQLQPFYAAAVFENLEAGDVAAGPRQVRNVAGADGIVDDGNTIGIVWVAFCTMQPPDWPSRQMMSGASVISSSVPARIRSGTWSVKRKSKRILRPSSQPSS